MPPSDRRAQQFLSNLARIASRGVIALLVLLLSIGKRVGIAMLLVLLSIAALEVTLRTLHSYILPVKISNEIATGYRPANPWPKLWIPSHIDTGRWCQLVPI